MGGVAQYVPTVGIEGVPDEQRPFTAALEHFLQQRISIPIMSSTADILSLERLFREVRIRQSFLAGSLKCPFSLLQKKHVDTLCITIKCE